MRELQREALRLTSQCGKRPYPQLSSELLDLEAQWVHTVIGKDLKVYVVGSVRKLLLQLAISYERPFCEVMQLFQTIPLPFGKIGSETAARLEFAQYCVEHHEIEYARALIDNAREAVSGSLINDEFKRNLLAEIERVSDRISRR